MNKENRYIEEDGISDNEIRIVGTQSFSVENMDDVLQERTKAEEQEKPATVPSESHAGGYRRKGCLLGGLALLICVIAGLLWYLHDSEPAFDPEEISILEQPEEGKDTCYVEPLPTNEDVPASTQPEYHVTLRDTAINDIPLRIYTCDGGQVELTMERPSAADTTLLLAAQAADMRSDIDSPAGAFVLHGELISKGYSKLGFCSIIDNHITIGYARETPEFETAIEQNGDFFRHYSLVCNGALINVPVKGKAMRRALCIMADQVCIVECMDRESYHDFSQALIDLGVREAIALVGGEAMLYYYDEEQKQTILKGTPQEKEKTSENYILWRKRG